jgi:hypothetical protein
MTGFIFGFLRKFELKAQQRVGPFSNVWIASPNAEDQGMNSLAEVTRQLI